MSSVEIPQHREQYRTYINEVAKKLQSELPYEGPPDITVVLGSGMRDAAPLFNLTKTKEIKDSDIDLPVGNTPGHDYMWLAGTSQNNKKVLIKMGRFGGVEANPLGTDTKYGRFSDVELATAYLRALDKIGTKALITTHAAGGMVHPMMPGDEVPFQKIPQFAFITNHKEKSFHHPSKGPLYHDSKDTRFFGPRKPSDKLMTSFENGVAEGKMSRICYVTSPTSPEFEDPAVIQEIVLNNGEAVGMSASPEKRVIDDSPGIEKFMQIAVITNPVQVRVEGGNKALLARRRKVNERMGLKLPTETENPFADWKKNIGLNLLKFAKALGMKQLPENEMRAFRTGQDIIPTKADLDWFYPDELYVHHPATHEEVQQEGLNAAQALVRGINALL
jgi:purine nucleoside phosphorylase